MKIGFKGFLMLVVLGVIIGMLLIMQIGGVSAKPAYVPPAPTKTPLEIEMEVKAAVSSFYMWLLIKWGIVIIVLLAGFWAVMRFLVVPAQKHAKSYTRDASGRYAMIRENKATLWQRLKGISVIVESDPNLAIAPVRRTKINRTGEIEVVADTYGADMEVQARHASKQIDVDKISAGHALGKIQKIPGGSGAYKRSHADHLAESGYYDAKTREAKMRGLAAETNLQNAQIRQQKMIEGPAKGSVEEIEEVVTPNIELNSDMAVDRAVLSKFEIEIGQADNPQRDIAVIDITQTPFIMYCGKTRSGKTTGAIHLVKAFVAKNYPVLVCEPVEKRDWLKTFGDKINHHVISSDNAVYHIGLVMKEYERRAALMEQHEIVNWQDAPEICPPWVVVWEELGSLRESFSLSEDPKAAVAERDKFDSAMKILVKKAANSGLIMIAVDQYPQKYDTAVRGQFYKIAYYMGGSGLGIVVDSPKNSRLRDLKGYFDIGHSDKYDEPIFYKTFYATPTVSQYLSKYPTPQRFVHSHANCDVEMAAQQPNDTVRQADSKLKKSAVAKPIEPEPIIERREPVTEVEYSLQRIYDRDKSMKHGKWQAFVRQYTKLADKFPEDHPMRKYPVAEIADRMAVCELGRYDKDLSDRRKSQASQWYSKIIAERQSEQPEPTIDGMTMREWQEIPV